MEQEIKQVGDFKLSFQQGLDKTGNICFLKYSANKELNDILKTAIIKETTDFIWTEQRDINGNRKENKIKRYKVKGPIFSALYNGFKDTLFIKEFVDKGNFILNFSSIDSLEEVKTEIKGNLRQLLKVLSNLNVSEEVIYKINSKE